MASLRLGAIALLLAFLSGIAFAHDYKLGALVIGNPWARATAPTAPAGGGYLTITNTGTTPDRLLSAKSQAAGMVQIHEMKMEGNVMRMRELEHGLEIPAGGTVALAPGGFHLMMMYLKEPLRQGTKIPVSLVFDKAGSIEIEFDVESMGATQSSH